MKKLKFKPEDFRVCFGVDRERTAALAQKIFDEWLDNAPTVYVHKQTIEMLQKPGVWDEHEKERGDKVGCLYVSMGAFAFPNFERNKEGDWPGVRAIIVGELPNGN